MSVVAVRLTDDIIEIAADSILLKGNSINIQSAFKKLVKISDNFIIGSVGVSEEIHLFIRYCTQHKNDLSMNSDIFEFMHNFYTWIDGLLNRPVAEYESEHIVIYNNNVYMISGLFIDEITDYSSIGMGEDFCNAAMFLGHSATEAVETACALCTLVAPPVISYTVERR